MSDREELQALCEAVLAVAGEVVPLEALQAAAGEGTELEAVREAVEAVADRYREPGRGLVVEKVAGGFRMATRPELEGALRAFSGYRARTRLSQAALETLAIVAYRQPVTLPEVNYLRGVNSAGVMRTLVDRRLVRVAGRKQVVGTPLLYRTTREFLVHFGLDELSGLPELAEPEEGASEDGSGGS